MSAGNSRVLSVQQKTWEAAGITSVSLVDPTGAPLPTWEPGAHIALHLPGGLVREYSLCSDPQDSTRWTVAVLRAEQSRGGSTVVHDRLSVGAEIEVEGPRNAFALDPDADEHILVAGGVGITPIVAMMRHLHRDGYAWRMLYAGRSRRTMAFVDEVAAHGTATIHADDETGGLPDLATAVATAKPGAVVYCCGPAPLLDAVACHVPDGVTLRTERFAAPAAAAPSGDDTAFDVVLDRSGQRIPVGPDISVLDALLDAGVDVPSSCTEGICGTCEVGVVKGDVDHRDFLLSESEHAANTTMFPCVSRCRSAELVLDI
ncbi:PDR/VanB family oxidoreductase [Gordonia sp. Z-3]|jgi:ferredoxin-NADP reductase|uniref:PDR/VanB family oxidoreductase n=1 Tax=Gordonia sp. Z-3 TaxID=3115408 RepID=UPI002E2B97C6|nr:PDR/VanB family oxidoreductase [Gordonia sp. Z-3]MED5803435.1 PDR/VanB family oxidoreductase [Gordonia sp. Z-3]